MQFDCVEGESAPMLDCPISSGDDCNAGEGDVSLSMSM